MGVFKSMLYLDGVLNLEKESLWLEVFRIIVEDE